MTVNRSLINIFDPGYAFSRASVSPENPEYPALQYLAEAYKAPKDVKRFYADGDTIPLSSEYYNYPEDIAVVINKASLFRIQFFRNGRVGNKYNDVHGDKELIRKEFEECAGTLMVMENDGSSRIITNNFDEFYDYLCLLDNARDEFTLKQTPLFRDYYSELLELQENRDKYVDANITTHYNRVMRLAKNVLKEAELVTSIFNKISAEKMNKFFLNITEQQRAYTFFGLFLFILKYGISQDYFNNKPSMNAVFIKMLHEFNSFLNANPDIIADYALYKNLDENEKYEIALLLKKERLLDNKYHLFEANGILD